MRRGSTSSIGMPSSSDKLPPLAPVCADKFRAMPDAEAKIVALSKVDSWRRRDEFPSNS
jgi:hypothetical protein